MWFNRRAMWISSLIWTATPWVAHADAGTEADRLLQSHAVERYNVAAPQASIRAGGARVAINAPASAVRQVVTDYAHYSEIMPRFEKSKIVNKTPAGTDVYLQCSIMHGAASVWAVTRFAPPRKEGTTEHVEGKIEGQGNVEDLRAHWIIIPIDDTHTELKLELLIVPKLPVPGSLVTPELEFASDKAVDGARSRAESNWQKASAAQARD